MRRGKYESTDRRRKAVGSKSLALLLACVLLLGGVIGGTVAWLTANSDGVTNVFTESDIDVTLSETKPGNNTAPMVPGWKIEKDPTVAVDADSEDCWLFVKITESTSPDLDAYISYAIASGWKTVQAEDENGVTVIGRKVYKDDEVKAFGILGAGEYIDPMKDVNDDKDDFKITWDDNQVCVKPSVTEAMMDAITGKTQPTLNFRAYAVQLFKTNSDGDKNNTADEFTAAEAWARTAGMTVGG